MKELVLKGDHLPAGWSLSPTHLTVPPGASPAQWANVASRVSNIGHGYWWWVGDLARFAQHEFEEPDQAITQLANATGSSHKYIRIVAWCCKQYPVRSRVRGLSISHHLTVAHLPSGKRQSLLTRALDNLWGTPQLRNYMQPRGKRTVTFVVQVPIKASMRARRELSLLCTQVNGKFHEVGTVRPGATGLKVRTKSAGRINA